MRPPWEKLENLSILKINAKPTAISAYTEPREMPLISSWSVTVLSPHIRSPVPTPLLYPARKTRVSPVPASEGGNSFGQPPLVLLHMLGGYITTKVLVCPVVDVIHHHGQTDRLMGLG